MENTFGTTSFFNILVCLRRRRCVAPIVVVVVVIAVRWCYCCPFSFGVGYSPSYLYLSSSPSLFSCDNASVTTRIQCTLLLAPCVT